MDDVSPPFRFDTVSLGLPVGMRDMLPARAVFRRSLARAVVGAFERRGYDPVVPPAFEREEIFLRGLGAEEASSLLRLVDPDSGEVLALRPDMTPQIARIIATHYRGAPMPVRLAYEGTVIRRPRGRARRHRQVAQAGVECVGTASVDADAEVIAVACEALVDAGVGDGCVEVAHAGVYRAILAAAPAELRGVLSEAMGARDAAVWRRGLRGLPQLSAACDALTDLAGGPEVVAAAEETLRAWVPARVFDELRALLAALEAEGVRGVRVDLAEARGDGYYTGMMFSVVCEGAGEAVVSGGRYDELLGRYGAPLPATGCAVAMETLEALVLRRGTDERARRAAVVGEASLRRSVAAALRREGWNVAELDPCDDGQARAWARAHGRTRLLTVRADGALSDQMVPW